MGINFRNLGIFFPEIFFFPIQGKGLLGNGEKKKTPISFFLSLKIPQLAQTHFLILFLTGFFCGICCFPFRPPISCFLAGVEVSFFSQPREIFFFLLSSYFFWIIWAFFFLFSGFFIVVPIGFPGRKSKTKCEICFQTSPPTSRNFSWGNKLFVFTFLNLFFVFFLGIGVRCLPRLDFFTGETHWLFIGPPICLLF